MRDSSSRNDVRGQSRGFLDMPNNPAMMNQYFAQLCFSERVATEYRRRLIAEGFKVGEGVMSDTIEISSDEESARISALFLEVFEEEKAR